MGSRRVAASPIIAPFLSVIFQKLAAVSQRDSEKISLQNLHFSYQLPPFLRKIFPTFSYDLEGASILDGLGLHRVASAQGGLEMSVAFPLSGHAIRRTQQRGIRMRELRLVLAERDREIPVGSGCIALTISRARRMELILEGYPPSVVDRANGLTVVESADGEVVTVLRSFGHRGRRYRSRFQSCPKSTGLRHPNAA
jgi:hypothetical protein